MWTVPDAAQAAEVCSCSLAWDWFVTSGWRLPSRECEVWERTAAAASPELCRGNSVAAALLGVCLSAAVWAAGKEAAEKCDYVYSTCYGALSLESFEETRMEYKSLTSHLYLLQSFNTAFKAKRFHFTGIWSCQVWSLVFSFACQSQNAFPASVLLILLFEVESRKVLWTLYLWDADKRSRMVSLWPKLSVTSNGNVRVRNK